jgi:hypothetical protein
MHGCELREPQKMLPRCCEHELAVWLLPPGPILKEKLIVTQLLLELF